MNNRRDFLKQSLLGAGTMALMNTPQLAAASGKPPTRFIFCLLYTSPSPRDRTRSRMPSSA